MSREETIEVIEDVLQAEYGGYQAPTARIVADVLASYGLLARPLPSYDEIVDACRNGMNAGGPFPWPAADAVLALLKGQEA